MSEGCPLLETIMVEQIDAVNYRMSIDFRVAALALSEYTTIDFRPCFERCPKLKHVVLPLCSVEQVVAMVQHCPLVKEVLPSLLNTIYIIDRLSRTPSP